MTRKQCENVEWRQGPVGAWHLALALALLAVLVGAMVGLL